MNIKMPTGRTVRNLFAEELSEQVTVQSSTGEIAVASVDNSSEGICPKCRRTMGIGIIPLGQVYYCEPCRVSTPIPEEV